MDTHSHHNHYPHLTFELTPHIIQKQRQNPEILGSALWGPALCLQIGQRVTIMSLSQHLFVPTISLMQVQTHTLGQGIIAGWAQTMKQLQRLRDGVTCHVMLPCNVDSAAHSVAVFYPVFPNVLDRDNPIRMSLQETTVRWFSPTPSGTDSFPGSGAAVVRPSC